MSGQRVDVSILCDFDSFKKSMMSEVSSKKLLPCEGELAREARRNVRRSFSVGGKGSLPSLSGFYCLDCNDHENPSVPADGATSPSQGKSLKQCENDVN